MKIRLAQKLNKSLLRLGALLVLACLPGYAEKLLTADKIPAVDLPIKQYKHSNQCKLEVATELAQWLHNTLQSKQALVAVVARNARPITEKYDATGMGHVGLAVYDPRVQSWLFYHLLNDVIEKQPTANLYISAPIDFFYDQRGYKREALIMLPPQDIQQRIYNAILNQAYKKLHFTKRYSLTSGYDSVQSINCTKWIEMLLVAAKIDDYDPMTVLTAMHEVPPASLKPPAIVRAWFSWRKPEVATEFYPDKSWRTVTAESLYRSELFTERIFFSGKILNLSSEP
ncbi:MAG TPA: DUF2145 domain-containing protein [Oculatellaceae cyanobacterium]